MAPKHELVRFAALRADSGDPSRKKGSTRAAIAVPDRRGTMPGRGGYLCASETPGVAVAECLELARSRGGMSRALRCSVKIENEIVESVSR